LRFYTGCTVYEAETAFAQNKLTSVGGIAHFSSNRVGVFFRRVFGARFPHGTAGCMSVHLHTWADQVHRTVGNTICPRGAPSKVVVHSGTFARIGSSDVVKGFDMFQHKTKHYFSPHSHPHTLEHAHQLPLTTDADVRTRHLSFCHNHRVYHR